MTNIDIRPWPELQRLLPPLSIRECRALADSIATEGVLMPILVLPDGRIIDGHHRWKLSGGNATATIRDIPEPQALVLGLILNIARRQMSPEQIGEVHKALREQRDIRRDVAAGLRDAGKTQAETAALVGVAQPTIALWEASNISSDNDCPDVRVSVPRSEYQAIYDRIEDGETQAEIAADYKVTRQRVGQIAQLVEVRNDVPGAVAEDIPLPDRNYRCIVIDPPWPMKKIEREVRQKQGQTLDYPVMTLDAIGKLPIAELADSRGCHIYLWVTQKYLPTGLAIFEQWGVKYQCIMTWIKPVGFTPFSWMYNTEHVLFGRIGSLSLEHLGLKLSFEASSGGHSRKPDVFYERVVQASPKPRLDMFARQTRLGFDVWGNEVAGLAEV